MKKVINWFDPNDETDVACLISIILAIISIIAKTQ
jgi:hypothetical protein